MLLRDFGDFPTSYLSFGEKYLHNIGKNDCTSFNQKIGLSRHLPTVGLRLCRDSRLISIPSFWKEQISMLSSANTLI